MHSFIQAIVDQITNATYDVATNVFSYTDVFSCQDDPDVHSFDLRIVAVGGTELVAVDGALMVLDEGLVIMRLLEPAHA